MSGARGYEPYAWLTEPDSGFPESLAIAFIHGLSPAAVAARLQLDVQQVDLAASPEARARLQGGTAIFDAGNGWTVLYEETAHPKTSICTLADDPAVDEAVLVVADADSVMRFTYWRGQRCVVGFEFPDQRDGAEPDALVPQMAETTGLSLQEYVHAMNHGTYLPRLLSLAGRITGVALGRDFLQRQLLHVTPS